MTKNKTKRKPTIGNKTVAKEVCAAYCEDTRNLNFKASEPVSVNDAVLIMTKALECRRETECGYNGFSPALLRQLPADSQIILAREGSVCVYVTKPTALAVTYGDSRNMKADEFHRQDDGSVRLWWD